MNTGQFVGGENIILESRGGAVVIHAVSRGGAAGAYTGDFAVSAAAEEGGGGTFAVTVSGGIVNYSTSIVTGSLECPGVTVSGVPGKQKIRLLVYLKTPSNLNSPVLKERVQARVFTGDLDFSENFTGGTLLADIVLAELSEEGKVTQHHLSGSVNAVYSLGLGNLSISPTFKFSGDDWTDGAYSRFSAAPTFKWFISSGRVAYNSKGFAIYLSGQTKDLESGKVYGGWRAFYIRVYEDSGTVKAETVIDYDDPASTDSEEYLPLYGNNGDIYLRWRL